MGNPVKPPRQQPAMTAMMLDLQLSDAKLVPSISPRKQPAQPHVEQLVAHSDKVSGAFNLLDHSLPRSSSTPVLKSQGKHVTVSGRKGLSGVRSGLPCLGASAQRKLVSHHLVASKRRWPSKEIVDFQQTQTLSVDWQ